MDSQHYSPPRNFCNHQKFLISFQDITFLKDRLFSGRDYLHLSIVSSNDISGPVDVKLVHCDQHRNTSLVENDQRHKLNREI